jgi:hypothetical protein
LRFRCAAGAGCAAATFTLKGAKTRHTKAFGVKVKLAATRQGTTVLAAKLGARARSALTRAGRAGIAVTLGRDGASRRPVRFRLVLAGTRPGRPRH